jgi:outer membrane protein TolC
VLDALEEVENVMVAYTKGRSSSEALARAVKAARQSVEISIELYHKGLIDFLNVLLSQRALYQAQDQLIQSRQNVATSLAALYKALGGGWQAEPQQAESRLPGSAAGT